MIIQQKNLTKKLYAIGESSGTILSNDIKYIDIGLKTLKNQRKILEKYLKINPIFKDSFKPLQVKNVPEIILLMTEASQKADVGPMAAVAGALADLAAKTMIDAGARIAIIENGGEASIFSDQPVDVALQIGKTELSQKIGFRIENFPTGLATSSGVYSHAFSFGDADSVTIFCENACLADAAATAVCNVVEGNDYDKAITNGIEKALSIDGIQSVFIVYGDLIGSGGNLPKILKIN
ncbi:UPF0280 family protein [Candidatus Bathyarchaeota archaeon]|nr:UPF0280 family protein [Candidatus Bathyarchaeota archaeon]